MHNRVLAGLIIAVFLLASCAAPQGRVKHKHKAIQHVKQVDSSQTWDFLADGFDEDVSAKVYAYILLPPTLTRDKQIQRLGEHLAEAVATVLKARPVKENEIQGKMLYWPIQGVSQQVLEVLKNQTKWQTWVQQYHVERAQLIYTRIQEDSTRPLLVVAMHPLAQVATEFQAQGKQILILDLNRVAPEKLTGLIQAYATGLMGEKGRLALNQEHARKLFKAWFGTEIESGVYTKLLE